MLFFGQTAIFSPDIKKPVLILPVEFRRGTKIEYQWGLEIKLQLTFTGQGEKIVKMRRLLIDAYSWDYTGQQADDSDDEEILEL